MSHKHDYWECVRGWLIPKLGTLTQLIEDATGKRYYVESDKHQKQFVGRVDMGEEIFEGHLHDMGFERNPMSAWKSFKEGGEEEGSFRKVGYDNYPDMQLHLVLYDGRYMNNADTGCVYLYAHWELRWDTKPFQHYNKRNYNAGEGVRRMKDLLDQNGIPYTLERPSAPSQ